MTRLIFTMLCPQQLAIQSFTSMNIVEALAENGFNFAAALEEVGMTLPEFFEALGEESNKAEFAIAHSRMNMIAKTLLFKRVLEGSEDAAKFLLKEYKEAENITQVFIEVPYVGQNIQGVLRQETEGGGIQ